MHTGKNNRAWHKADKAIANRLELHRLLTSRFVAEGLSAAAASKKAFDLIMLAPANDVRNAIEKLRGDDELLARLHDGLIFPNGTAKPIGGE